MTTSEADRLKFVAGAEHAKAVGSKPCRLFAWMVRGRRWEYITQADEDAARSRLRELRGIRREVPPARPSVSRPPPLSEDALLVRSVRAALGRAGYRGDPFPLVRREKPEWTRERWDLAVLELDGPRRGSGAACGLNELGSLLQGLNLDSGRPLTHGTTTTGPGPMSDPAGPPGTRTGEVTWRRFLVRESRRCGSTVSVGRQTTSTAYRRSQDGKPCPGRWGTTTTPHAWGPPKGCGARIMLRVAASP